MRGGPKTPPSGDIAKKSISANIAWFTSTRDAIDNTEVLFLWNILLHWKSKNFLNVGYREFYTCIAFNNQSHVNMVQITTGEKLVCAIFSYTYESSWTV